jgi:arylsulfatase A-like enzyme
VEKREFQTDSPLTRRGFLSGVSAQVALTLAGATRGDAAPAPPNIVFILADDMGYGDVGCYGQQRIRTPHIDRIAAEGMRFTQFYSGSTVCSPSRCSFMTGLHTGHTRVRGNDCLAGGSLPPGPQGAKAVRRMYLLESDRTVGNYLQKAGYRTGLIGKWHLDAYEPTAGPLDRGFDEFYGWLIQTAGRTGGYFPTQRHRNRELVDIPENQGGKHAAYEGDLTTRDACDFIRRNAQRPFFLYVSPNMPHSPIIAPSQGSYANQPWSDDCRTYAAMVEQFDNCVGSVLQTLKDLRLDERTIVFAASDNGPRSEPTAQLTAIAEFFDSNGPFRGYKRDLYEGGIRVPMVVRWPGRIPKGRTSALPAYFADFLPTAVQLAGQRPPALDGISLVGQLTGQPRRTPDRFLYWEFYEGGFSQAVRWGEWKAVRLKPGAPLELFRSPPEIYRLTTDVGEQRNVAADQPKIVARIEAYLRTARTQSPEYPIPS